MKRLKLTNFTLNSNLAIYLCAYIDKICRLAILDIDYQHTIMDIIPYLKQMHLQYKTYKNENELISDSFFHPDLILTISDNLDFYNRLNNIATFYKLEVIIISSQNCMPLESDWYSVKIYSVPTTQTTYLYHTNLNSNVFDLIKLNNYKNILIEWLPEI